MPVKTGYAALIAEFPIGTYLIYELYHKPLDLDAGLLLSRCMYWSGRMKQVSDGWFTKDAKEWAAETNFNEKRLRRARERLVKLKLLEKEKKYWLVDGKPRQSIRLRVNFDAVRTFILEHRSESGNAEKRAASEDVTAKSTATLSGQIDRHLSGQIDRTKDIRIYGINEKIAAPASRPASQSNSEERAGAESSSSPLEKIKNKYLPDFNARIHVAGEVIMPHIHKAMVRASADLKRSAELIDALLRAVRKRGRYQYDDSFAVAVLLCELNPEATDDELQQASMIDAVMASPKIRLAQMN